MRTFLFALLASFALLLVPQAPEAQADSAHSYLSALDQEGISYTTPQAAVRAGYGVCMLLDEGATLMGAVELVYQNSPLSHYESGYMVGAAISAFCPRYVHLIG